MVPGLHVTTHREISAVRRFSTAAAEQQSASGLRSGVRPAFPRLVPFAYRPMNNPGYTKKSG